MTTNRDVISVAEELQDFANSMRSGGYVKTWKAHAITWSAYEEQEYMHGDRLKAYVANCLEMEGFIREDYDEISKWLEAKIKGL